MAISATRVKYLDQFFHSATADLSLFKDNSNITSNSFIGNAVDNLFDVVKGALGDLSLDDVLGQLKKSMNLDVSSLIDEMNDLEIASMFKEIFPPDDFKNFLLWINPSYIDKYDDPYKAIGKDIDLDRLKLAFKRSMENCFNSYPRKQVRTDDFDRYKLSLEISKLYNELLKESCDIAKEIKDSYSYTNKTSSTTRKTPYENSSSGFTITQAEIEAGYSPTLNIILDPKTGQSLGYGPPIYLDSPPRGIRQNPDTGRWESYGV